LTASTNVLHSEMGTEYKESAFQSKSVTHSTAAAPGRATPDAEFHNGRTVEAEVRTFVSTRAKKLLKCLQWRLFVARGPPAMARRVQPLMPLQTSR
jgi:hypothetical protein